MSKRTEVSKWMGIEEDRLERHRRFHLQALYVFVGDSAIVARCGRDHVSILLDFGSSFGRIERLAEPCFVVHVDQRQYLFSD